MDKINIEQYEKLVKILEEYPSLHTEFEDSQCSHSIYSVSTLKNLSMFLQVIKLYGKTHGFNRGIGQQLCLS